MRQQQRDRRRPVTIAVAATAVAAHADRSVACSSCGKAMPLDAAWIIPQGFVICTECAAPVLRADLERRIELIRLQDAGGELRAVAVPASLSGVAR